MPGEFVAILWGWYPAGKVWVKIQVDANGKLVIDPTALFEEPPTDGEMGKAATSNWSHDHAADPSAHHVRYSDAEALAAAWANINTKSLVNLITNGDFESGDPPIIWTFGGTGSYARSNARVKTGSYSARVIAIDGSPNNLYQVIPNYAYYKGLQVTLGCWLHATVANRARMYITDGAGTSVSAYHSGGGAWELITLTRAISAVATFLIVGLQVYNGATTAYFDGAILAEGDSCPAFAPRPAAYEDGVPSGTIVMWSGLISAIPTGWAICDGNNGTPNLLAKFVEGVATAATNPGATGGALKKYLTHTSAGSRITTTIEVGALTGHGVLATLGIGAGWDRVQDDIADIRPPFYDLAFIMKL